MFVRVGSVDVEKIYVGFVVLALQERIVFYWFSDGCVSFVCICCFAPRPGGCILGKVDCILTVNINHEDQVNMNVLESRD